MLAECMLQCVRIFEKLARYWRNQPAGSHMAACKLLSDAAETVARGLVARPCDAAHARVALEFLTEVRALGGKRALTAHLGSALVDVLRPQHCGTDECVVALALPLLHTLLEAAADGADDALGIVKERGAIEVVAAILAPESETATSAARFAGLSTSELNEDLHRRRRWEDEDTQAPAHARLSAVATTELAATVWVRATADDAPLAESDTNAGTFTKAPSSPVAVDRALSVAVKELRGKSGVLRPAHEAFRRYADCVQAVVATLVDENVLVLSDGAGVAAALARAAAEEAKLVAILDSVGTALPAEARPSVWPADETKTTAA